MDGGRGVLTGQPSDLDLRLTCCCKGQTHLWRVGQRRHCLLSEDSGGAGARPAGA